ncbi:unnamed protein product [Closterium sp. NIES-53]
MAVPATRRFPHRSPTALLLPLAVLTLAAVSESARLASVSSVVSTFSSPKLVNDSSPSSSSSSSSSSRSASSSASVSFAVSSVESHDDVAELEDEVSAPRRMMLAPGWMLWRMANSNRCRPSSLQGYTSSRKLGNGFRVHAFPWTLPQPRSPTTLESHVRREAAPEFRARAQVRAQVRGGTETAPCDPFAPLPHTFFPTLHQPRAALESRDGREAASGGASGAGNAADGPPLVLHWTATTGKRLRVAVLARAETEAAAAGWVAVGWSPKGDMDGSDVVAREADSAREAEREAEGMAGINLFLIPPCHPLPLSPTPPPSLSPIPTPAPFLPPLLPPPVSLVLHWRATTGKRLRVAVMARAGTEAAAAGWFAVGWSPKGDMDGSNVVAREADSAPIAYDLSGHDDATESRSWGVQDASVEHTANGVILR